MAKRASSVSEVQVMIERLQYLAGRVVVAEGLELRGDIKAKIFKKMGYTMSKNEATGKLVFTCGGTGETIKDIYVNEYYRVAKKLEQFYTVLNHIKSERLKLLCEYRYSKGYSWAECGEMLGVSEASCYAYRNIIKDIFVKHNCEWAIGVDADN